jgi:hypothetical protein
MRIAQLHERVHRQQDLLANAYIDAKAWVDLNVQSYRRAHGQDEQAKEREITLSVFFSSLY